MIRQVLRRFGIVRPFASRFEAAAAIVERDSIERPPFHKISGERAELLGGLLLDATDGPGKKLPLAYLLAVVRQESRFDPDVTNPNLAARTEERIRKQFEWAQRVHPAEIARVRSLPEEPKRRELEVLVDLLFTDWGLAQVSGRNLFAEDIPPARALNPKWAAVRMAVRYRSLTDWAKDRVFERNGKPLAVDPLQTATLAYNKGPTGATLILEQRTDPIIVGYRTLQELAASTVLGWKHVRAVMGHYRRYLADFEGVA